MAMVLIILAEGISKVVMCFDQVLLERGIHILTPFRDL
jgi:hypothetical protein